MFGQDGFEVPHMTPQVFRYETYAPSPTSKLGRNPVDVVLTGEVTFFSPSFSVDIVNNMTRRS
jgi:hypothetical protein